MTGYWVKVFVTGAYAKYTIDMRDANAPKLTLAAETFRVHSLVVLFC